MIVPFPPGMTPAGAPEFSLLGLMSNMNAYAESFISVTTAGTNTTLTAAQLLAKNIVLTAGASGGFTLTLPATSKVIDLLGPTLPRDGSFWFPLYVSNETALAATLTAADSGSTFVGGAAILADSAVKWMVHVVAPTTSQGPFTLVFNRVPIGGAGGAGSVTDVSVVTANGFAGTVATSTSTPAITISLSGTSDRQVLFNNGGSAVGGSDGFTFPATGIPTVKKAEGVYLAFKNAGGTAIGELRIIASSDIYNGLGIGFNALAVASTTTYCTALGSNALAANTSGTGNMAIGTASLEACTTGGENTAVGVSSARLITTGGTNTAIGANSMSVCGVAAERNTALGRASLQHVTSSENVGVGSSALNALTSGDQNTGIGYAVCGGLTTGSRNVLIGHTAGGSGTGGGTPMVAGNENVGVGAVIFGAIPNGSRNIAIGFQAGPTADVSDTLCLGYAASVTAAGLAAIGSVAKPYQVGINMTTPSAWLHLPAGTATAGQAPLKLTSGTVLGTPEDGAIEFDGTHLYVTIGGTRRTVTVTP